jgi:hypothetical protein
MPYNTSLAANAALHFASWLDDPPIKYFESWYTSYWIAARIQI